VTIFYFGKFIRLFSNSTNFA